MSHIPDPDHVSWLIRFWTEVKNTPTEVVLGFIGLMTVLLKLAGKLVKKDVELNPRVSRSEMEDCRDEMLGHMDTGIGDLKSDIKDLDKRIDDLYKLMAKGGG